MKLKAAADTLTVVFDDLAPGKDGLERGPTRSAASPSTCGVTQLVDGNKGIHAMLPKRYADGALRFAMG
jgi:hypothetical protein